MKFFTIEWWLGIQSNEMSDPLVAFAEHIAILRDKLPPDLIVLHESVSLHDAILRSFEHQADFNRLTLIIHGYNGSGVRRLFTLCYDGVRAHRFISDPKLGFSGTTGFGDLGYCEPDILPDGLFQHRMLFSSGIELQIDFTEFKLVVQSFSDM